MERLHLLADEVRETFDDRGWKIEKATQLDSAFRKTRKSQSSLGRDLVVDAIEKAAPRIGLACLSVGGGGYDVVALVDGADRRFRVLKAKIDPDTGEYNIICRSDSIFVIDAEPDSLFRAERWVLGYTVDDDGMVVDIFAARVLGRTEDAVPRLRLGPVTLLGVTGPSSTPPSSNAFQPADEDDLGEEFEEDNSGEDAGQTDAS